MLPDPLQPVRPLRLLKELLLKAPALLKLKLQLAVSQAPTLRPVLLLVPSVVLLC